MPQFKPRFARLAAPAVALALSFSPLLAQAADGEQWEYTQKMEMMGMKMPMPPMKVCEKANREFLAPVQKNCKVDVTGKHGDKVNWKMKCGEPDPMDGEGWSILKGDQMSAEMDIRTKNGDMHVVTTGKKLGSCALKN